MRRVVFAALFVAFGVVLPMVLHLVGMGGPVFLPMHIPVLLGGLTLGPGIGLLAGLLSSLRSRTIYLPLVAASPSGWQPLSRTASSASGRRRWPRSSIGLRSAITHPRVTAHE